MARLGQFQYGPEDSPWYGVSFSNSEDAKKAYQRTVDLSESKLPRLFSLADEVIEQTNLREFETVAELTAFICACLSGIRETLDRFSPDVFDRSLTEVIAAHAPRGNDNMNQGDRRRLKKLAREYVRPGGQVTDMYSRLVSNSTAACALAALLHYRGCAPRSADRY